MTIEFILKNSLLVSKEELTTVTISDPPLNVCVFVCLWRACVCDKLYSMHVCNSYQGTYNLAYNQESNIIK